MKSNNKSLEKSSLINKKKNYLNSKKIDLKV